MSISQIWNVSFKKLKYMECRRHISTVVFYAWRICFHYKAWWSIQILNESPVFLSKFGSRIQCTFEVSHIHLIRSSSWPEPFQLLAFAGLFIWSFAPTLHFFSFLCCLQALSSFHQILLARYKILPRYYKPCCLLLDSYDILGFHFTH